MGLRDILTGMQNGPRGQPQPSSGSSGGGMSPIVIALLGLLAYKALKGRSGHPASAGGQGQPARVPPAGGAAPGNGGGGLADVLGGLFGGKTASAPAGTTSGGNLGDLLKGGLGGLLGGAAAGSVLSGGLGDLLNQLQQGGHGETASTWVGKGENKAIAPGDLASALGADQIQSLSAQSGLSRDELLSGLSQYLPQVIDHLTPDGRLPTEGEVRGRL